MPNNWAARAIIAALLEGLTDKVTFMLHVLKLDVGARREVLRQFLREFLAGDVSTGRQ
mgnify:CR=1 FL=1